MSANKIRIAMIAPPWIALPVKGYGGIELVVQGLVEELSKMPDVEVTLFANGARRMRGVSTYSYYKEDFLHRIDDPYYDAPLQILQTHLNYALKTIEQYGNFDIIHDHNPYIGPTFFAAASRIPGLPPVLHTFHGPPFSSDESIEAGQVDNRPQLQLLNTQNFFSVCISESMAAQAPTNIRPHMLETIYNAVDVEAFPFVEKKQDFYITLARFTTDKGQVVAARFAAKYRKKLRMAGTIGGIGTNRKLLFELSNPMSVYRKNDEFRYYSDEILPFVFRYSYITYAGNLGGKAKLKFISNAKALLFPVPWEEPFGMAVIEALACGTPVVAMNRGAMSEIIKHGVNGFLADTEEEFFEYANRVDEIDPLDCRKSVEERFTTFDMAKQYMARYKEVIERTE